MDVAGRNAQMKFNARPLLRCAGLAAVAAACLLGGSLSQPAQAGAPPAIVSISPANQSVPVGTQVVVNVNLAQFPDPDGLGAYEVALTWDANVLTFASYSNGTLLTNSPGVRSIVVLPALLDADGDTVPDLGYARIGVTTIFLTDPPQASSADGLLATVRFNTRCGGSTVVTFDRVTLSDPLATSGDIPVSISGGNATVTGSPTCSTSGRVGDANCNGTVNAIDAAIILQGDAGLLHTIPCANLADVNHSGHADALDALLVLQYDAGLLSHLPP
jgi:hypothetical protein